MIGAYYQYDPIAPINGLGQEQTMNDVASQQMQNLLVKAYPIGIFVPWAIEISEGQWQDIQNPENRYGIYPVTATQLEDAEKAASGQPVGFVAAMSQRLLPMSQADQLFEGTPYEFFQTQGVYSENDTSETPKVSFLYWGSLRDEDKRVGSYATLARQASNTGVTLVYPISMPIEGVAREKPWMTFNDAVAQQSSDAQAAAPAASAPSAGIGAKILFLGIAVGAGFLAYRWAKKQ